MSKKIEVIIASFLVCMTAFDLSAWIIVVNLVTNENGGTEINGLRGITLLPGSDPEVPNSTNDNVQIIINERLNESGKAQYVGHEAYGHAYMYSRGKPSDHIVVESNDQGFVDSNKPLVKQIKKRENESIKNSSY